MPALRLVVAELRMPLPVIPEAPPLAVSVNVEPEEAARVTTPLFVSTTLTAPVELRVSVDAFSVLVPTELIPAVPAVRFAVAALSAPAGAIPLAALLAFKVNDVADEAFRLMVPAKLSTRLTAPLEFAVSVEADTKAFVALMVMPPLPEVIVRVGVLIAAVEEIEPVPLGLALRLIEVAAESAAVSVMLPPVDASETLLALIFVPMLAEVIALLLLTLTAPFAPTPLTAFVSVTAPALEVNATVPAEIEPAVLVMLPDADKVTVPIVPAPAAARLPATFRVPAPTARENASALPAEEALNVTAAAESLLTLTLPVVFKASVAALVELSEIPPLPAEAFSAAVVRAPLAVIEPVPLGLALSVKELEADKVELRLMLPAVDESEMLLAVRVEPMLAKLMELAELMLMAPLAPEPVTALDKFTDAPVELRLTVVAVIVPTLFVRLAEVVSETEPMVPVAAARLPARSRLPLATFRTKLSVLPAEEAPSDTAAAESLAMLTLPVELSASVAAFKLLLPVKVIPAVPAVRLVLVALMLPAPLPEPLLMPDALPLAASVNEEAEDAPRVIRPLNLSTAFTTPVELRVRLEAFSVLVPVNEMPAVPALRLTVAELRAPAPVIPLAAFPATKVKEEPEEAFKVVLPE